MRPVSEQFDYTRPQVLGISGDGTLNVKENNFGDARNSLKKR